MEVFGRDWILGTFKASNYGLYLASFNYNGDTEEELGFKLSTMEEFVGNNPIPIYIGDKHEEKLRPQITLCKNPCKYHGKEMNFSQKDCREILRLLTGIKGYQWMKLDTLEDTEDVWFRAKITNVSYKRVGGNVVGLIFQLECDSCYGYSTENIVEVTAKANKPFYFFNNTDDLNNYVLPIVEITPTSNTDIIITNTSDNNWVTEIKNAKANETIIINSQTEIISSDLNNFNLHFPRIIPETNKYVLSVDAKIVFKFRAYRKVGFN